MESKDTNKENNNIRKTLKGGSLRERVKTKRERKIKGEGDREILI